MFNIGDRVKTSTVFHTRFYDEAPMTGTIIHVHESSLLDETALPYKVLVDQWGTNGSFAADELDLL